MKPTERKRVARAIRAVAPELQEKGRLLAATPRGRVLRGVYLEDSSDPARFYVWVFVQPLYVPASTIAFDLGKRLGGASRTWGANDPESVATIIREEGVPFLTSVSSPEALVGWSFLEGRSDPYALEAKAYSLVASGRFVEGVRALRHLARLLSGGLSGGAPTPWMVEMQERAEQLADFAERDPSRARDALTKWEAQTATALRVQDLR